MKNLKKSILSVLALGLVLAGCQSDGVKPKGDNGVSGAMGDAHPTLDVVCQTADSIFFQSADGSEYINKCGWEDNLAEPVACVGPQERWGYMVISNGIELQPSDSVGWLNVDFALPYGWYCTENKWKFKGTGQMEIDGNTGRPALGAGWSSANYNPARAEWKVTARLDQLPFPGMDMSCNLSIVPIDVNGLPLESFRTELWAKVPTAAPTGNGFVMSYLPNNCMGTGGSKSGIPSGNGSGNNPPVVTNECKLIQTGIPALSGCTTLDAGNVPGATYSWSNGATTRTINACPTTTTAYSVTVSVNNAPTAIKNFNVNYQNVKCTAGNSPHHKVRVCHRPPGNPTNVQNICIDWSAVPAHVARFRPAGSTQGHDSGCELGTNCNSVPCQ
jgi:hypothetical protein